MSEQCKCVVDDYENFELRCKCGAIQRVHVQTFPAYMLYKEMNRLEWGLIPTQHNEIVQGVCPECITSHRDALEARCQSLSKAMQSFPRLQNGNDSRRSERHF